MNRLRVGLATRLAVVIAAAAILIALTWLAAFSVIRAQRAAAEGHIEADMANEAALFAGQVQADLLEVDETLHNLAQAWEADPSHFQLLAWRDNFRRLNELSPELFIADEHGTKRDSTVPESIGSNIGDSDYFRALSERIFDDGKMFVSPTTISAPVREWHLNLGRPLFRRDGSFAGVIVARFRTNALDNFYRTANIGAHGTIAIVGLDQGQLRFALGPNPIDPGTSIAGSDMFKAIAANPDAIWVGRSALDGVPRVHGFHRIADRDMAAVVAVDHSEAIQPTETWAFITFLFAGAITALLLLLAAIRLHAIRAVRRREAALEHERAVQASASTELELTTARADAKSMRLEATFAAMSDGVALFDADLQLAEWSPRFPESAGIPSAILRPGLPIEDIVRAQAEAGLFGNVDIEAEVARQIAALRTEGYTDIREHWRLNGRVIELRRGRLSDGGLITVYRDTSLHRGPLSEPRYARADAAIVTAAAAPPALTVSSDEAQPVLARGAPRTRVLLVSDAPTDQVMTAASLRRAGHFVDVAGNGPEAIGATARQPYDLVLMDILMPGMSGIAATRLIRVSGGPAATTPIVGLIANPSPEDQAAASEAGMDGVLEKPLPLRALLEAIAHHAWPHHPRDVVIAPRDAPTGPTQRQILSPERLEELRAVHSAGSLANLVEERLFDLSERLALLQEAVRRQAMGEVLDHADAMARMAGEYGMTLLETRLRTLADQSPASVEAAADELEAELFRASTALREALHIEMV